MTELNAFYWRENYRQQLVVAPGDKRRNAEQVSRLFDRVKTLRAAGKSRKEVAETLGITVAYVRRIEVDLRRGGYIRKPPAPTRWGRKKGDK